MTARTFVMSDVDVEKIMEDQKQDAHDRRCKTGKYAPKTGVCRVCGSHVVADISFDYDGRIGGPPVQGHVSGWHCEGCELVYRVCPPAADETPKGTP